MSEAWDPIADIKAAKRRINSRTGLPTPLGDCPRCKRTVWFGAAAIHLGTFWHWDCWNSRCLDMIYNYEGLGGA